MIEGQSCSACRLALFPPRLRCPRCGSENFDKTLVRQGVLEECTVLLHVAGRPAGAPVRLGTVLTDHGARVVARLDDAAEPGSQVRLACEAGAIVARTFTV